MRSNLLGEQTAENDKRLLLSTFIETPEYRSLIENKDSTVVVGRRGTGKSAMFVRLSEFWGEQKASHVIKIAPEDYQTISFRGLFKNLDNKYSYIRAAARQIWKYGFLQEMLTHLSKNYKTRNLFEEYPSALENIKKWSSTNADFFSKTISIVSPLLKKRLT